MVDWAGIGWSIVGPVAKRIGGRFYDRYLSYTIRRDIRLGTGSKIGIIIARLTDDSPSDSHRATLYESIRRELGDAVELTNWPEDFRLGHGHQYDIERAAYDKAQKLLAQRNCDLLISGRVKGQSATGTVLSLRFTVAEADDKRPEDYRLTDTFDLPANFIGNLGAALSARVILSAAPAVHLRGQFIIPIMRATAARLAPIVAQVPAGFDPDTRGSLFFNYANVQSTIGEQAGSNDALVQAVEAYRAALLEFTRERVPLEWAASQNNLGNALAILGARESGTERLQEAVEAYRAALLEYTRERVPLKWAMTQNNLGTALRTLGARESGTERLQQAVEAFRAALLEYTHERVPLEWAATQNNLGAALKTLGERESGPERLQQAVEAYRAALLEFTRERVPLEWTASQNNLGNALRALGERESSTERLSEAVEAYRAALLERTRERVPLDWAMTQNNLGNALATLGERESSTERLQQAVEAYRGALAVFEEANATHYIEGTRNNLARAERLLAERRAAS